MKIRFFVVISLVVICCTTIALADTPTLPPDSYKEVVGDGKFVLVMLAEDNKNIVSSSGVPYRYSGLYKNDGSTMPIWKVDWYDRGVKISPDGQYLVRFGGNLATNGDWLALSFYKNGKETKTYYVSDLILSSRIMPPTVSHFNWRKDVEYDSIKQQVKLTTYYFNEYVFDVKTGKIISGFKYDLILAIVPVLIVVLLIYSFVKRSYLCKRQ